MAWVQEMMPEDLLKLTCGKNRFGEKPTLYIRPDFDEGTFTVVDSPKFLERQEDIETLKEIIAAEHGQSQNAVYKKAHMRRGRVVKLLAEGKGIHWRVEMDGSTHRYFPLNVVVPNFTGTSGNNGNR